MLHTHKIQLFIRPGHRHIQRQIAKFRHIQLTQCRPLLPELPITALSIRLLHFLRKGIREV